jgi:hypothetical protein
MIKTPEKNSEGLITEVVEIEDFVNTLRKGPIMQNDSDQFSLPFYIKTLEETGLFH